MTFLHPALLLALPLVLVPIVVHLLNRRRFSRRPWGAMRFLQAAAERNRARLLMEHWVVLLLRALAVLLLVLMVARPRSADAVGDGGLTRHVVLLDDSASTAEQTLGQSIFAQGVEDLLARLEGLSVERPDDPVEIRLLSRPTETVGMPGPIGGERWPAVRNTLRSLAPSELALDVPAAVTGVLADLGPGAGEGPPWSIHLLTDLRRRDWWIDGAARRWTPAAERLAGAGVEWPGGRVPLTITPLTRSDASPAAPPLGIAGIELLDRLLVAERPARLAVRIVHRDPDGPPFPGRSGGLDWSLQIVDGSGLRTVSTLRLDLPPIPAGGEVVVPLRITPVAPGHVGLTVRLPGDAWSHDDVRHLVLPVSATVPVWVVDGDPGSDAAFHTAAALDPEGDGGGGVAAEIVAPSELARRRPGAAAMVWMCDPPRVSAATAVWLQEHVASGGGLVFLLGDQADPVALQERLGPAGVGLWPGGPPGAVRSDGGEHRLVIADLEHPLVSVAPDSLARVLQRTTWVRRWRSLVGMAEDAVTVLHMDDPQRTPVWLEYGAAGQGRVTLIGLDADPAWTNLPATPAWLLLQSELLRLHGHRVGLERWNHTSEGRLQVVVDPVTVRPDLRLVGPDGQAMTRTAAIRDDATAVADFPLSEADGFGLHRLERTARDGSSPAPWLVARNAPWREGDPVRVDAAELAGEWPEGASVRLLAAGAGGAAGVGGSTGIWRWAAWAGLLFLLMESWLAGRFGRH